jgi:predicted ATPase/DNA-binding winged helix-turn-helix (wHTH) protein
MQQPAAFVFGPFRLMVQRRELLLHGIPVTLGQRAIEVLLALVSRGGELVTKDEIMAGVWPGVIVEENNLQVHISALRKAFGSAGDPKSFLQTVAGRGYRFVAPVEIESDAAQLGVSAAEPTPPARPANLPQQLTSFVGRKPELDNLTQALQNHRLVSLTGAGGVGKTRLAIEAGWQLLSNYPDGVWVVELAPLQEEKLVAAAVAEALGIESSDQAAMFPSLAATLAGRHTLLILDNCEHLIAQAAAVAEALLRAAPGLHILATSRERLAIDGETVLRVPSLALPAATATLTAAQAQEFDAVRLFVERARVQGEVWPLSDASAAEVAAICRRLDGIPLAIEMAVPMLRVLSLSQLNAGLDARFKFLSDGSRTALPRHRTLQAVIDWSYALLSDSERRLLQRLSNFAGSVGLDAVTAVTADSLLPQAQVLGLLTALIDKSLVVMERDGSAIRYRLLETTGEYAREKIAPKAALALRRRHADYYRSRLEQATAEWETTPGERWLHRYAADLDEVRASLHWAFGPQGDAALGLELVANSHVFWGELGMIFEHRRWVQEALARTGDSTPKGTIARLLSWHVGDVRDIDDPSDYDDAMRAAQLHAQLGNAFGEGQALLRAGSARLFPPGDGDGGEAVLGKAYSLLKPFGATKTLARCLSALASSCLLAADLPGAKQLHEQAVSVARKIEAQALDAGAAR